MATVANASNEAKFTKDQEYVIRITGFTYVKEWALIKGTEESTGEKIGVIIGDKMSFGMRDMFELKNSEGIKAGFSGEKIINGKTYNQFYLTEILF